jgi:hypothetical protein
MLAALELASAADQVVEANHVVFFKSKGQAKLAQIALRTGDFQP